MLIFLVNAFIDLLDCIGVVKIHNFLKPSGLNCCFLLKPRKTSLRAAAAAF